MSCCFRSSRRRSASRTATRPSRSRYQVNTFNGVTGLVDATPAVAFDAADPGVGTDAPLYQDQGNTAIPYTLGSAVAKKGTKALVLHLHGADGKRAEVVKLAGSKR